MPKIRSSSRWLQILTTSRCTLARSHTISVITLPVILRNTIKFRYRKYTTNLGGNAHDFKVGGEDKKKNELYTKGTLDREDPPDMLYVVVEASNSCERNPTVPGLIPCTAIDLTKPFYLNVSIDVRDPLSVFFTTS